MSFSNEKNTPKASLDDVAKALGVSKSTVSRVLSGKGRISEETRKRVMQCAAEMNYQPNVIARSLAQSKTFNIGVVLPYEKDLGEIPFFQNCLTGICETVSAMDYDVVVAMAAADDASQLDRIIRNRKVDGVILTRSVTDDPAIKLLKENDIPFVLIGSASDNSIVQIDIDHESACSELTTYLISSGCSRTALLLGSRSHNVNLSRYNGFVNAFAKTGKTLDNTPVYDNLAGRRAIELAVADIISKGC
ncbi:MAG: LacI family DNA-binding transcriptional regulator, partial [Huintestinicola sp.]